MSKYPSAVTFAEATKDPNPAQLFLAGRVRPIACQFTQKRVDPFTVPVGSYVYELRTDADGSPCALEAEPIEDCFGGAVITKEHVDFGGKSCISFADEGNGFEFVW